MPNKPKSRKALPRSKPAAKAGNPGKGAAAPACPEVVGNNLTVTCLPGEGLAGLFRRMRVSLQQAGMGVASILAFGPLRACKPALKAMEKSLGPVTWPVTWVQGEACGPQPIAGLQAIVFHPSKISPLRLDGRIVGSIVEDGALRHCLLGGIGPRDARATCEEQFQQTKDALVAALGAAGFSLADVVRTWFFLEDLLSWYDAFNAVRTKAYAGTKFRCGSSPASTGISGKNPQGAAIVESAWAIQPLNSSAQVEEVISPLQCPAPNYGSTFSRAVEISSPEGRRVLISGTASISADGRTIWEGDLRKQIARTMKVVEAILVSRGCKLADITRTVAYITNGKKQREFTKWCAGRKLDAATVVATECGICRHDLLFELEADAWTPTLSR
jgi:enamine deaminase RidA (YjgF/YER057c/UK114 family)